jgi:hypothetical protein
VSGLNYEPRVILEHANRLNRRADSMGLTSAIIGAVIGGFFGAVPLTSLGDSWPIPHSMGFGTLLGGLLVGALTGYVIGDARAFGYRLQAQSSLCQLHLERNTAALLADTHSPAPYIQPAPPPAPVVAYVEPAPEPEPEAAPEAAPEAEAELEPELEPEPVPVAEAGLPEYLAAEPEYLMDEPEAEPESPSFVTARISAYLEPAAELDPAYAFDPAPIAALVPEDVQPEHVEPEHAFEPEPEPAPLVEVPALPAARVGDGPPPDLDSMSLEQIAQLAKTGRI